MEEKKKLSAIEREKLKFQKLQQEMLISKKRIEEAKNREALKVWKKIKPLFLKDEVLEEIQDPTFTEMLAIEIQQILEKYIPVIKEENQEVRQQNQEIKQQIEEEKEEEKVNE